MEKSDDENRIAEGKYNADEIIKIALKELSEKGFIILRQTFPQAHTLQLELAIPSITKDNKYILEDTPYSRQCIILNNPSYKEPKWQERHYILDKLIWVVVPAILGLTSGLLWQLDKRSTTQDIQLLKDELKLVNQRLDSLQKSK
jgi:hypothetical protein